MDTAQWLTRGTVWVALTLYVAGEWATALATAPRGMRRAVGLNGLGLLAFIGHVLCAFQFHHHWSHAAAYADTARQTAEFTGWHWGGGLYVNYLFLLVWLSEFIRQLRGPTARTCRPRWRVWIVRAFFLFMILNGAVIFVRSPMRWFGLLLCALLLASWWWECLRRNRVRHPDLAHE